MICTELTYQGLPYEFDNDRLRCECAWCGRLMRDGKTINGNFSHGICPECTEEILSDYENRYQTA